MAQAPQTSHTPAAPDDLERIYQQLVKGLGHELVNDDNADALAQRADQDGHTVLATELREWKAPC